MLHNFKRIRDGIEALPLDWVECASFQSTATQRGNAFAAYCAFIYSSVHRLRWCGAGVSPRTLTLSPQPTSKKHMLNLTLHRIFVQSLQDDVYQCLTWTLPLNPLIRMPNLLGKIKLRLDMRKLSPSLAPPIPNETYAQRVDEDE